MKNGKDLQRGKTQSEIAFRLQNLMMVNLKQAFRTYDSTVMSKYLEISNFGLAGIKEG